MGQSALKIDSTHTLRGHLVRWLIEDERFVDARSVAVPLSYEYGLCEYSLGRINEAVAILSRISPSDSTYPAARYHLAMSYLAMGQRTLAMGILRTVDTEPWRSHSRRELARLGGPAVEDSLWQDASQSKALTRAQFAFLLVTILKPQVTDTGLQFRDLDREGPLTTYARKAVVARYLESLPDQRFYPDYVMKRRNLAFYLSRIAGDPAVTDAGSWKDVPKDDWLLPPIRYVVSKKLVLPLSAEYFGADERVSGTEAVEALQRLRNLIDGK